MPPNLLIRSLRVSLHVVAKNELLRNNDFQTLSGNVISQQCRDATILELSRVALFVRQRS